MSGKSRRVVLSNEQQAWNAVIIRAQMLFKITYFSILEIEITPCISLCFLTFLYIIIAKVDEKLNMSLSLGYHHTSINWRRLILKTSLAHVILTRQQLKQCNGYSAYFGLKKQTSSYCGSFQVGQCTVDELVVHFHEFMKRAGLNPNFILSLGMDDPNLNLLFQNKLRYQFSIIDVGKCILHIINSAFGKAVNSLRESVVDLDKMAFGLITLLPGEHNALLNRITGVTAKTKENIVRINGLVYKIFSQNNGAVRKLL